MLKGIDVNQRIEFVSQEDTTEPKTIFVFKPLSGLDMIELSKFYKDGQMNLSGQAITEFLDRNIVEIKNIEGQAKLDFIKSLPGTVLTELVNEGARINSLTEQDEKN